MIMSKKSGKRLNLSAPLLTAGLLVLLSLCLTGCIPNEYTKEEARDQEKAAMEIFARYLEGEPGEGKIVTASVHAAVPPKANGYYLTDFVDGSFTYEGESYKFVVNTRTEEIFTSLRLQELKEMGTDYVQDYFQISCDEIIESHMDVELRVPALSQDKENRYEGMSISLASVVPVSLDVSEDSVIAILEDETYTVNMDIIYKGKEGPEPEGYGIEALPGLRSLKIKHMKSKAEASDELGGIYDYMMSDILEESVRKDSHTVRYTRWDHLEEGNFHLFFETYCREITDGDVVETEVEKGRDIELLVEDERVEVDCYKDIGYFLFAENLSESEYKAPVAWEHLLNNGYTDTKELRWLKDGNRFAVGIWEEPNSFNGWSAFYLGDEARKQLKGK